MNLLFTVCGRAGSKGVKSKNLKRLLQYPLAWYPLSAIDLYQRNYLKKEDTVHICASSDSEELLDLICNQQTCLPVFPIRRGEDLSNDLVAKVLVTVDCLKKADEHFGVAHDLVIDLDITSPLRTIQDVENAIEKKKADPGADVVFSVVPARRSPFFSMVAEEGTSGYVKTVIPSSYTARQQTPQVYDMNGSIYVYERSYLLRDNLSQRTNAITMMKDVGVLDIDRQEDFDLMELVAKNLFENDSAFAEVYENLKRIGEKKES